LRENCHFIVNGPVLEVKHDFAGNPLTFDGLNHVPRCEHLTVFRVKHDESVRNAFLVFYGNRCPRTLRKARQHKHSIRRQERLWLGLRSVSLDPVIFMAEGKRFPICLQPNTAAQNKVTVLQVVTRTPERPIKDPHYAVLSPTMFCFTASTAASAVCRPIRSPSSPAFSLLTSAIWTAFFRGKSANSWALSLNRSRVSLPFAGAKIMPSAMPTPNPIRNLVTSPPSPEC
jgi:hypothetical protein